MRAQMRVQTRVIVAACVAVGVLVTPAVMRGWGMDVHRLITEKAIDGLPAELKAVLRARTRLHLEHSVDRSVARDGSERSRRGRQSLDGLRGGSKPPFLSIPRGMQVRQEMRHRAGHPLRPWPWRAGGL
jgi:hypothetical protein